MVHAATSRDPMRPTAARAQRGERVGDVGRGVEAELGAERVPLARRQRTR